MKSLCIISFRIVKMFVTILFCSQPDYVHRTEVKLEMPYINDLTKVIENCSVAVYADDTGLCLRGVSCAHLNEAISKDLENLDNWIKVNKLSLKM